MAYKPTGQLLGNVPQRGVESEAPSNLANAPGGVLTHPPGAAFLSWGEGASASQWNRPFVAVSRNVDRLRHATRVRPIAIPIRSTTTEIPGLTGLGGVATVNLAPGGSFDGWVYHGSVDTNAALTKLFRLLDLDGTEVLDAGGSPLEVDSIAMTAGGANPVGTPIQILSAALTKPAATTDPKHKIAFAAALSDVTMDPNFGLSTSAVGLRLAISLSQPNSATEGSNNGNYLVAEGVGSDSELELSEYRYRLRLTNVVGGPFAVNDVLTGGTSGAVIDLSDPSSGVEIGAAPADWVEFDLAPTPGGTGKSFLAGETITGFPSGATATVIRYSAPEDPVLLNNDMAAPGTGTLRTDGSFSRLVTITFTQPIPAPAADRVLLCGTKGFAGDLPLDALLVSLTGVQPGNTEAEISEMKGGPADWKDTPKNVLGAATGTAPNVFIDLDAAYRRALAQDPAARVAGAGRVVTVDGGPLALEGGSGDPENTGLLDLLLAQDHFRALRVDASVLAQAADRGGERVIPMVFETSPDLNRDNPSGAAPAAIFQALVPLYGNNGFNVGGTIARYHRLRVAITYDTLVGGPFVIGETIQNTTLGKPIGVLVTKSTTVLGIDLDAGITIGELADNQAIAGVTSLATAEVNILGAGGAAPATEHTLVFDGVDGSDIADPDAFTGAAPFTNWLVALPLLEVSEASDPDLNGYYWYNNLTATSLTLLRIGGGLPADVTAAPDTGTCRVKWFGRSITMRGLDLTKQLLQLVSVDGEEEILRVIRVGSTADQKLLSLEDGGTSRLKITLDDSSADAGYEDNMRLNLALFLDKLRSASYDNQADANGAAELNLASKALFKFLASRGGGDNALKSVVEAERVSTTAHYLRVKAPGGAASLGAGEAVVLDLSDYLLAAQEAGGEKYVYLMLSSGQEVARFFQKINEQTTLKLYSPVAAGNLGNADLARVIFGNEEVELTAVGTAVSGYPEVLVRKPGTNNTLLKLLQDGGTQGVPTPDRKYPYVAVPDLRYGADYAGYAGKPVRQHVDLFRFHKISGSGTVEMQMDPLAIRVSGGRASFALQIPPFNAGGSVSLIRYNTLAGGPFQANELLNNTTTGKKIGRILAVQVIDADEGYLYVAPYADGGPLDTQALAGATSLATAVVNGAPTVASDLGLSRLIAGRIYYRTSDGNSGFTASVFHAADSGGNVFLASAASAAVLGEGYVAVHIPEVADAVPGVNSKYWVELSFDLMSTVITYDTLVGGPFQVGETIRDTSLGKDVGTLISGDATHLEVQLASGIATSEILDGHALQGMTSAATAAVNISGGGGAPLIVEAVEIFDVSAIVLTTAFNPGL